MYTTRTGSDISSLHRFKDCVPASESVIYVCTDCERQRTVLHIGTFTERMAMNARIQPNPSPLTHRLTSEELRERWIEMGQDPLLAQIPYKLEMNERGSMEVSPATTHHAVLQAFLADELRRLKPDGITFTRCPIETEMGVRVADVAWGTSSFVEHSGMRTPLSSAPELCIEIVSRMNTRAQMLDKVTAYLAAGAHEVWLIGEQGRLEILSILGEQPSSCFGIDIQIPRL